MYINVLNIKTIDVNSFARSHTHIDNKKKLENDQANNKTKLIQLESYNYKFKMFPLNFYLFLKF
jgi:hypothetical protein